MARFKIIRSSWQPPHLVFEIEVLDGSVPAGQSFSVWDTRHRFDFTVAEVQQQGGATKLLCTSDFLKYRPPDKPLPDVMFAGKQVDTADPSVAQSFSHKWGRT